MTATVFRVYRIARSLRAAVYHVHDPELIPAALLLSRTGARIVYDAHEDLPGSVMDKEWIPPALRRPVALATGWMERAAADRFAAVVAATPSIAEDFAGARSRVVTVNNYSQPAEFDRPAPTDGAVRGREVCFVGVISEIRGVETRVRAIAATDARLVLAGRFSPPELRERLEQLPGWAQVVALGVVERARVAEIMAGARAGIVVFRPARNHVRSQPTKMFEYMAAGLPVIVSSFPLWREIVEGNRCGLCVDPDSPEELAGAIRWVLGHPRAAREMGAAGREAVRSKYTWDTEAAKLEALYASVLRDGAGPGPAITPATRPARRRAGVARARR
jgi:glycosyltransferase involved in cell wall biosynthesis